jgi:hypothetical protein
MVFRVGCAAPGGGEDRISVQLSDFYDRGE